MKEILIKKIDNIINSLQLLNTSNNLNFIIEKYVKTKNLLIKDELNQNVIKGSVRAYLNVFSDHSNPILDNMYDVEKEIDIYIDR